MAVEIHSLAAYAGAITSILNLMVLLSMAFKTGRFIGEIEGALKVLQNCPDRVSALESKVAVLEKGD